MMLPLGPRATAGVVALAALVLGACAAPPQAAVARSANLAGPAAANDDNGLAQDAGESRTGRNARLGPGDYADAGSSAIAAASGLTELNPAYASLGPAAPVAMLGLKYGGKKLLTEAGLPADDVNRVVESVGMLGGCYNMMLVAGAAAPPAAVLGAACGVIYNDRMAKRQRASNTVYLDLVDGEWVKTGGALPQRE